MAMTFIRADSTDAGPPPVVIVMGDSLSLGCCAPTDGTFQAIFSTRLGAEFANISVGAATAESLINEVRTWPSGRRQPQLAEAISLMSEAPDVAAISLGIGTIDVLQIATQCLADPANCETVVTEGHAQFQANMEFILDVLSTASQPATRLIVMNIYVGGQAQPMNSIIASEVTAHGVLLADVASYFDELPDLLATDGIHKIRGGHRVIADVLTNTMPPDRDGDGLSDLMEAVLGSDPDVQDTDGDRCSDGIEFGPRASEGGQRDPTMSWDFFDVWTHPGGEPLEWERNGRVNIFDILLVAARFGPGPAPPAEEQAVADVLTPPTDDNSYHIAYDRGPVVGPNAWDSGPPDGTIDVVTDILGVATQFGHNCMAQP